MTDSKLILLHSVNAGFSVSIAGRCFFIDALHNVKAGTYSTMTDDMVAAFLASAPAPDLFTCTHMHPDHYSEALAALAGEKYPDMIIVLPDERELFQLPGFSMEFIRMRHLSDIGGIPGNYCIVVRCAGKTLFFSGDSDPKDEDNVRRISGLRPDFALLSFPWITLSSGRRAVNALDPQHLAVGHLPLAEDDEYGYREAVLRSRDRYFPGAVLFEHSLQNAEFVL